VSLYGVVLILSGCVRVGALDSVVSTVSSPFCGPGSGVSLAPAGPFLYPTPSLYGIVFVLSTKLY
jgi:hypothetical protein